MLRQLPFARWARVEEDAVYGRGGMEYGRVVFLGVFCRPLCVFLGFSEPVAAFRDRADAFFGVEMTPDMSACPIVV